MVADDGLPGVSAGNPESTATGYARMSVKVANQCDLAINCNKASCEQMQAEQEQVPRRVVTEVGMISEAPPCKRQKQGQNDTGESAAGDLARKAGMVVVDNVVWKELLLLAANFDATHAGGLPLPQTWGEARKFVSVLEDFLKDFPARFGCGHTDRRAALIPQNAKYCRKSMTRKIVLWAQSCSPERAWQDWTAGMLAEVCPDPTGDLGHLNPAQQA